jgi:O-antigen ligase
MQFADVTDEAGRGGLRRYAPFAGLLALLMSVVRIETSLGTSSAIGLQERYELACQGVALAIFLFFSRKPSIRGHLGLRRPLTWMLIFGGFMSLSALWSELPFHAALKGAQFMLISALTYVFAVEIGDRRRVVQFFVAAFLTLMGITVMIQVAGEGFGSLMRVYETAGGQFNEDRTRLSLLSIHPLTLADVTGCLLLMLLVVPGAMTPLTWMGALVIFGAHILSWGRFAIGTLLFCWLLYQLVRTRNRPLGSLVRWCMGILCVAALLFTTRITDVGTRQVKAFFGSEINTSGNTADMSLNGRTPLWAYTFDTIATSPLTNIAVGPGYATFRLYGKKKFAYGGEAHNAYLQILFELGIIGLALMIVMLANLVKNMEASGRGWRPRTEAMIPMLYLLLCGLYDSALADSRSFELLFLVAYCVSPLITYRQTSDPYA